MAQGEDTEHVFYIAGTAILGVHAKGDYDLWLLDRRIGNSIVEAWDRGGPAPQDAYGGRIRLNVAYTVETPGPNGEVHCIPYTVLWDADGLKYDFEECLSDDVWNYSITPAVVAVSKPLWDAVPSHVLPLPTKHVEDYRLRIVARRDASGSVRYYLGFHVEVVAVEPSLQVQFYDWGNIAMGIATTIDLTAPSIDPPSRGHTTIGASGSVQLHDTGALFVAVDSFATEFSFLIAPKVPFGGGAGGSYPARRRVPEGARRFFERTNEPPAVVISDERNDWLDDVRDTITVPTKPMHDEASAQEAVMSWLTESRNRDAIELISHANDHHVLAVGAWRLTAGAFRDAPAAFEAALRGKTLRIVGCATARGAHAREALCDLKQRFGLRVFGTRGLIGTADLTYTGTDPAQRRSDFVVPRCSAANLISPEESDADEYVVTQEELERGGPGGTFDSAEHDVVFGGLSDAVWAPLLKLGDMLLKRRVFAYPGLLQLPTVSRGYPVGGTLGGTLRVDALFRGQVLRLVRISPSIGRREYLFLLSNPGERARVATAFDFHYE
ncbi:MAG: DUF4347 domain-containing protein [Myxococcales bacterium]|nr:DUF4347 domain-containing protein [Myxococcales bacterium]